MDLVSHDGRASAVRVRGSDPDRPTVLFVHGSGGTHGVWKSQVARLPHEVGVAALDLAGHGDAEDVDANWGPPTLDAYAADVAAVARAVDAAVLVGNSLGGAVVLHALLEHDVDPDAAVLVGSGAKLGVADRLLDWLADDFDRAVDALHAPDVLFHDPPNALVEYSRDAMRAVGRRVTERDFRTCDAFDVRDRLGEIGTPTLALTGEHDQLTPPAFHEYLADELPDGTWTTIPDAAHLSFLEEPDAFDDALLGFLDDRGILDR